jgi:hypothetical protein
MLLFLILTCRFDLIVTADQIGCILAGVLSVFKVGKVARMNLVERLWWLNVLNNLLMNAKVVFYSCQL